MNYEEFCRRDKALIDESHDLREKYYKECTDRYKEFEGKRVIVSNGVDSFDGYWGGWEYPSFHDTEPILYKVKSDGSKSKFRHRGYNLNPGNIHVELYQAKQEDSI